MAKYKLKSNEIEAMRVPGPDKIHVVGKAGEQTAAMGDFILFYGPTAHEREVISASKFNELYELVDESQKAVSSTAEQSDYAKILALLTGIKAPDALVGPETVLDEAAVADLHASDEKLHEPLTSSVAPLDPEAALGKTSGDGKDAGDWTQHGDGTTYP